MTCDSVPDNRPARLHAVQPGRRYLGGRGFRLACREGEAASRFRGRHPGARMV